MKIKETIDKITTKFPPTWYNIVTILFIIAIILFYGYSKNMGGIILNFKRFCYITIPIGIIGITAITQSIYNLIVYKPKH